MASDVLLQVRLKLTRVSVDLARGAVQHHAEGAHSLRAEERRTSINFRYIQLDEVAVQHDRIDERFRCVYDLPTADLERLLDGFGLGLKPVRTSESSEPSSSANRVPPRSGDIQSP